MDEAKEETAVIVVDMQKDFTQLAEGALAVDDTGPDYIDKVREGTEVLKNAGFPVFATMDWHPIDHISFYTRHEGKKPLDTITVHGKPQVLWPPHCVQGTAGAEMLLDEGFFQRTVKTGTHRDYESYSGFQDDGGNKTPLHRLLQERGITKLVVYGIATDYCVRATALDAVSLGYGVLVIRSLSRGVAPKTSKEALAEMEREGVILREELDLEQNQDLGRALGSIMLNHR